MAEEDFRPLEIEVEEVFHLLEKDWKLIQVVDFVVDVEEGELEEISQLDLLIKFSVDLALKEINE